MKTAANIDKSEVFESIQAFLDTEGFKVVSTDHQRPWGGFFVIDESQAPAFIAKFFSHLSLEDFAGFEKLSPKILVVAPQKRLSWQYHHRRAEIWKLIAGVAGVVISDTDKETIPLPLSVGQVINLKCGERHRLLGADGYGVVAEIWQHTDKENPSNEDDIVRVQDDFGR
ncbi:MAG: phosphoheptose isomerase [Cytophagaceae bacterium]|nr:phosphoheptose isomerase [Cytophagaceae bacterium]MBK9508695.1 phosphoheptose isomerase [Cytophagaceae bacterium]MBK9935287.1 phosphoheptose isomerase [Cytophagaceae bacterium]MBL0301731.1 phosphoheptose isomerase [Cytophagaceae bacterium]MBL0324555.1 phosphoheptose isomerase [Cytophagaceae bacterium]